MSSNIHPKLLKITSTDTNVVRNSQASRLSVSATNMSIEGLRVEENVT